MSTNSDTRDWLALTLVSGIGNRTLLRLLTAFGSPAGVRTAGHAALSATLSPSQTEALRAGADPEALARALDWLAVPGNHLVTLADPDYPQVLLETGDPPAVLYAKGRRELLGKPALAIVGSRHGTAQGLRDAESFARTLADAGLTIVSGLALGIDAAAHRGGLAGRASSIAVVGTGLDRIYPAQNKALAHQLAEEGLILSEFPLGTPPLPGHFPQRNRIISGLARGVLVVEAAPGSGSLITARVAAEQGREVFAIPGSIHSPLARGCHALIRQGAKLVETAADVLEELGWQAPHTQALHTAAGSIPAADPLLDALGAGPLTADQLAEITGLTLDTLSGKLLALELAGHLACLPGGRYQKLT